MVDNYDLSPEDSQKIYLAISKFFDETSIGHIVELLEDKLNSKEKELYVYFKNKNDLELKNMSFYRFVNK